jgi:hypothetical protein
MMGVAALFLLGCNAMSTRASPDGGTRDSAPKSGRGKMGEPTTAGPFDVVVHAKADPLSPESDRAPKPVQEGKSRLVAFDVELKLERGSENKNYSAAKWHLYDLEGHAFEGTSLGPGSKEPKLIEGILTPGNKARGWVTFEVPAAAKFDRLEFFTGYLSADVATIAL